MHGSITFYTSRIYINIWIKTLPLADRYFAQNFMVPEFCRDEDTGLKITFPGEKKLDNIQMISKSGNHKWRMAMAIGHIYICTVV